MSSDFSRMDANRHFTCEPRVLISRDALLHNVAIVRKAIGNQTRLCAILKADAYGHGAALVADALCNFTTSAPSRSNDAQHQTPPSPSVGVPAVDAIAVASIDEAIALTDALPSLSAGGPQVIVFR